MGFRLNLEKRATATNLNWQIHFSAAFNCTYFIVMELKILTGKTYPVIKLKFKGSIRGKSLEQMSIILI